LDGDEEELDDGQPDKLVICDVCYVVVHQSCYSRDIATTVPEGDWVCQRCMNIIFHKKYRNAGIVLTKRVQLSKVLLSKSVKMTILKLSLVRSQFGHILHESPGFQKYGLRMIMKKSYSFNLSLNEMISNVTYANKLVMCVSSETTKTAYLTSMSDAGSKQG
jgi:hypothetical protein